MHDFLNELHKAGGLMCNSNSQATNLVKSDGRDVLCVDPGHCADLVSGLGGEEGDVLAVGDHHHLRVGGQRNDALDGEICALVIRNLLVVF